LVRCPLIDICGQPLLILLLVDVHHVERRLYSQSFVDGVGEKRGLGSINRNPRILIPWGFVVEELQA